MALKPDTAILFHLDDQQHPFEAELSREGISLEDDPYGGYSHPRTERVVTLHTIHPSSDPSLPPAMGSGRALSPEDAKDLAQILTGATPDRLDPEADFIDGSVLYASARLRSWFVPGRERTMYIQQGRRRIRLDVTWPSLVFAANARGKLFLAATSGARRPHPGTPLYHAPLMNIYASTAVCQGSVTTPAAPAEARAMPEWEDAIFRTWFTHTNHPRTFAGGESGSTAEHIKRWRELAKAGRGPKAADMNRLGLTLGEWITRIGGDA
ncbi:hypothetical protein [Thioalkalivibrio sp. ALE16]|uniref:hypothetical protein n=1 Tax=Thioalkalivibrio sp. ALE16 TaxID=1158172 RepID=UPI0003646AE7|nr:hypothetical protein [Thioalkalivibrio sp. ALE16]